MYQSPMMLLLNTETVVNKEEIENAISDIKGKGFDSICLEFRYSLYDEFDQTGLNAMRIAYNKTKKEGLGFIRIIPHCSDAIFRKYNGIRQKVLIEYKVEVQEKSFCIELEKVEGRSASGIRRILQVKYDQETIAEVKDITDGFTYCLTNNVLQGKYDEAVLLVYAEYEINSLDYSHEYTDNIIEDYFHIYKEFQLDGFALDEFGAGSRLVDEVYLCGDSFLADFKRINGYDFLDKVYLMNNRGENFAKVRYDYYKTTMDITYDYQQRVKRKFEEIYGKDKFIGFHHTWWGEGNSGDLWAGNIDYFRLCDNLSGGFVDAQYDSERTMTSMNLLAEGIAKYTYTKIPFNMCWDRFPTHDKMDYFHRMLAVRNIRWVGHFYGEHERYQKVVSCPGYPKHPTWEDASQAINREEVFQSFFGKAIKKPKVALLYLWESCAYENNIYMHYHRLSMKAFLDKMMLNNIEVDLLPSFETNLDPYEVIYVLWGQMMLEDMWNEIKRQAKKGKRICFMGPPAEVTTSGRSIRDEFDELTGSRIERHMPFMGGYEYYAWDLWFTDQQIPMMIYQDKNKNYDFVNGNVEYRAYEYPLTDMFYNEVLKLSEYKTIHADDVISHVAYDDDTTVFAITPRWQGIINHSLTLEGNEVEIKNGILVGIKIKSGNVTEIISETGARICINGKEVSYKPIGERVK